MSSLAYRTSRQAQLQRALGDVGEVLPRITRGEGPYRAAGWYARIDGELFYLGDHSGLAFVSVAQLLHERDS